MSVCALLFSGEVAQATFIAGLLMTANVKTMEIVLVGIQKGAQAGAAYAFLMVFKLAIMLGLVAALILVFHMSIAGVALGLSTLLVGVAVATVHHTSTYSPGGIT
jgi:ABC-type multidrug transport system permease subunit